jgi:acetyl/propionyl-CoA carboxylase alpha subunit
MFIRKKNQFFWVLLVLFSMGACSNEPTSESPIVEADTVQQGAQQKPVNQYTPPAGVRAFNTITTEFNSHYKRALYYSTRENKEEILAGLDKTEELWKEVLDGYLRDQPAEYTQTQEWVGVLQSIDASLKQAQEKAGKGQWEEVYTLLKPIRGRLRTIRVENGIDLLRDHIIVVNDNLEEALLKAPAKENETLASLEAEIEVLANWPARQNDPQYLQRVDDLKRALEKAQQVQGDEYAQQLKSFREILVPFYLFYG